MTITTPIFYDTGVGSLLGVSAALQAVFRGFDSLCLHFGYGARWLGSGLQIHVNGFDSHLTLKRAINSVG